MLRSIAQLCASTNSTSWLRTNSAESQHYDPAHRCGVVLQTIWQCLLPTHLALCVPEKAEVLLAFCCCVTDKMIKLVAVEAEGAHQSIRRARQKGMDAIKKAFKNASADDKKRTEKEVWQYSWQ
jgi:hypothetical protein